MEEDAMDIPLLGPSLLAGVECLFISSAVLDITPAFHPSPPPPQEPGGTSSGIQWPCHRHQGILSGMFRDTGMCWLQAADTASSALLPFFSGRWHLRRGVFCPWKWWLKLEPETAVLCMHAASFSSAVLGFWKCLVVVGSFPFLCLPSFWARKSCWLEGCRCAGICC